MSSFSVGFIKRAMDFDLSHDDATSLYNSIFNKDQSLLSLNDSSESTPQELGNIAGAIGKSAIPGAVAGGAAGYAMSTKKDRLKKVLMGASLGGLGTGAIGAYNLGDNTRTDIKNVVADALNRVNVEKEENSHKFFNKVPEQHFIDRASQLENKMNAVGNAPWYSYYNPQSIMEKLK